MLLPGFIKRLLAVFRGSVAPPLIFISALIGFWFGLMPGFYGLHVALIVVVLILNVHLGLFLLSLGLGKALALAGAPVLYHVGLWAQDHLAWLLSGIASVPVIGMTDFSRYAVAGGLIIGPVIGAVAGLVLAFAVFQFRQMMVKLDNKSEKFRLWYSKTWVRILDRLLIGKRAKDVQAMFVKTKYIRKVGIVLAVIVIGGFFGGAYFLQNTTVKSYATETLTRTNGAEVNLESLGLSIMGGNVAATGLQVTDAQKPEQNQIAVGTISADASVYDLLLGRLVMEKVEVSGVQFNQLRQTPGEVVAATQTEEEAFDPCEYEIGEEELSKLDKYVKDAKKIKEQLQKLRQWLPEGDDEETATEAEQKPQTFLEYLLAKAATPPSPKVLAKQILANDVNLPSELFGNSLIQMANLSDAPEALGEPVTLELKSNDTPAAMKVTMDYSQPGTPAVSGTFEGFDLSKVQSGLGKDAGLSFQSGTAAGTFTGKLTKEQIDLTINLNLKDLQAKGEGDGVLGLGAEQTSEVMEVLKELTTTIRVVGPTTEPRLVFDSKGLTEEFKQALVAAGKERVLKEVNEKLEEELGDKVPDELKDAIKKPSEGLMQGLGGLLGGKKKDDQN